MRTFDKLQSKFLLNLKQPFIFDSDNIETKITLFKNDFTIRSYIKDKQQIVKRIAQYKDINSIKIIGTQKSTFDNLKFFFLSINANFDNKNEVNIIVKPYLISEMILLIQCLNYMSNKKDWYHVD